MARALFDYYRIGIQKLLEAIGPNHHSYADALTLQLRLEENLSETDLFGADPSRQAQRAQILHSCNRLSISATGRSFYYFCGLPEPPPSPRVPADELHREAAYHQLTGDLGYALQLYRQVQQLDPTYPRIDALIADVEREMRAPYVGRDGFVNEALVLPGAPPPPPPSPTRELAPLKYSRRGAHLSFISIGLGLAAFIVLVLLILLYLWLRGMIG